MDGEAAPRHSSEPGHLAFGKLVDSDLQLSDHLLVGEFPNDVKCEIFVLQSVIDKVLGLDTAVEESAHFVDHSFVETAFETSADLLSSFLAADIDTDDEAVDRFIFVHARYLLPVIFLDLDASDCTLRTVGVRSVVQRLVRGEYLRQFVEALAF